MAAVDRELKITYGTFVVGGTSAPGSERLIHDFSSVTKEFDKGQIRFTFVIRQATEALFATEINAVEEAFRQPRLDILVEQGSSTLDNLSHLGNTYLNPLPIITKPGSEFDTGRSRMYEVTIDFELPADNVSTNGRRDSSIELAFTSARRRILTVSGTYTALTSTAARKQYNDNIDTYIATILSGFSLTGKAEIVDEVATSDDQDKILEFRRVFEEIIFDQSTGTLDDANIVNQEISINKKIPAPGDSVPGSRDTMEGIVSSGIVRRLVEVTLSYQAWIDKDKTLDLVSEYEGKIRTFLITTMLSFAGAGSGALIDETPSYDPKENRIAVNLTMLVRNGSNIIEFIHTEQIRDEKGLIHPAAWTGDALAYYEYQGPQNILRTVTERFRIISSAKGGGGGGGFNFFGRQNFGPFGIGGGGGFGPFGIVGGDRPRIIIQEPQAPVPGGAGGGIAGPIVPLPAAIFRRISETSDNTPLQLGIPPFTIDVVDIVNIRVDKLIKIIPAQPKPNITPTVTIGGGGGGGGNQVASGK